jgi:hypothetical protein
MAQSQLQRLTISLLQVVVAVRLDTHIRTVRPVAAVARVVIPIQLAYP